MEHSVTNTNEAANENYWGPSTFCKHRPNGYSNSKDDIHEHTYYIFWAILTKLDKYEMSEIVWNVAESYLVTQENIKLQLQISRTIQCTTWPLFLA